MQFTNHFSAELRPDLLGELTELDWLDPLAGYGAPRKVGEKGTRMEGGNVEGKGDKASGSGVQRKGRKGADRDMEGRQKSNGAQREGGLEPESGGGT